jgi:hypothetical protein
MPILAMVSSNPLSFYCSIKGVRSIPLGITPFVKPEDLAFFFEEIHRLTAS